MNRNHYTKHIITLNAQERVRSIWEEYVLICELKSMEEAGSKAYQLLSEQQAELRDEASERAFGKTGYSIQESLDEVNGEY